MATAPLHVPGSIDSAANPANDARQWRPGSFALRNAWFPIAHTPQVSAKPIRREIHGQPFFLWRDGARIRAAEFLPYEIATRRREATELTGGTGEYPPVIERYGYAWVWYGNPQDTDVALMPDVPYLPLEGKLPRHQWGTVTFDCTYELTCENLLDLTHADFLHAKIVGGSLSEDDTVTVESTSETVTMIRETKGRLVPPIMRAMIGAKTQDLRAVTHIHLRSGVTILHGQWSPGLSVRLFHPDLPVNSSCTKNNFTFNNKLGNAVVRNFFPLMANVIGKQDNRMLKVQNPRYLEEEDRPDFSSRFDTGGLTYRRRFKALVERQKRGDFSYLADGDPSVDITKLMGLERDN
ncbi:MAG: Oxygenase [Verrucomicrobiaceae bacterium]|nr:Oxygenase [Verrucomicrobiaceae bacterium]